MDIQALATAVETGGGLSPAVFAALCEADRVRLEQTLLAKQKARVAARLALEAELKRVAEEDARLHVYLEQLRESGGSATSTASTTTRTSNSEIDHDINPLHDEDEDDEEEAEKDEEEEEEKEEDDEEEQNNNHDKNAADDDEEVPPYIFVFLVWLL